MEYEIRNIDDPNRKSRITGQLLSALPEWFGDPESNAEYAEGVKTLPFWAAFDKDDCVGFFAAKIHYGRTGEIYVCAVDSNYHRKGIGKALYGVTERYLIEQKCAYVIVKTLSDIVEYAPYEATHRFYRSVGFTELITLTEMWDEENPCLIMLKRI